MKKISKLGLINIPTEKEIENYWKYTDKIYISCICITYNQELYIEDTINGFLSQKCEYKFEIIIYDDASTDETRKILLAYKEKYPSIIKLILQDTNQYSLKRKTFAIAWEKANGDFIALCEGDDYWIDDYKLQKQITVILENPNINLVITKATSLYPNKKEQSFCDLGKNIKIIPFYKCILGPKKDFFPTATFFFRKKIIDTIPDWFYTNTPVSDYYIQLFSSYPNGCIYLPNVTSIYRRNSIGSWSSQKNIKKKIIDLEKRVTCNLLIINTLELKQKELLFLKKRKTVYIKELTHLNFINKNIKITLTYFIKGILTMPIYYFSLILKSLLIRLFK
ncbi:glycosyltransferase [Proteus mirabilis]|uniref:glycosyltransferase n=5 Tax=Enterobacterales TaxID=91347 RepID=UPI000DE96DB2|nr:glycosyltransferase [Proteus mirabilis]EKU4146241.1 glycosyltransferase [Proteus mirabilis]ELL8911305.1 glycosyltransferase [Proteus mirabilis]MBG2742680.1 glycosyltransferase [Proteus mirabilis]MBG2871725.1 glycosyltransferase [Proteus mirabilis]MBI6249113.1 glycosyltransferase [Proteus mirabilis]